VKRLKKSFVWKNPICRLWRAGLSAECARIILAFGTFQCQLTRPPPGQFFMRLFVVWVGVSVTSITAPISNSDDHAWPVA
jgi:hypothetical protein